MKYKDTKQYSERLYLDWFNNLVEYRAIRRKPLLKCATSKKKTIACW
jgi:hypothetical protein